MSHYVTIKTKIRDAEILKEVLRRMEYPFEEGKDLRLYGFEGILRPQTADIVIRSQYIGAVSNDIGFKKVGDYYDMIISQYDRGVHSNRFKSLQNEISKLQQDIESEIKRQYVLQKTITELKKRGFAIVEQKEEMNKTIRIIARKWS